MKIIITDAVTLGNDLSLDLFSEFGEVRVFDNIDREALLREVADVQVILCNKTVVDREVMEAAAELRYIGLFATGYNNIDVAFAKERGIAVCNAGSYSTNAVAQQVMGYILMHYTRIPEYNDFVKQGGWKRAATFCPLVFRSEELFGRTVGIIGFGNIGRAVKRAAEGFGMRVIVFTRTPSAEEDVTFVSFDELLEQSDIVTVHCPLNDQSRDMMNARAFAKMKDGAFFINTARGGVVDESALRDALCSGKLSGAAVDVLKTEPMPQDCTLFGAPNLIMTPHTAWAPYSTRIRVLNIVSDNLKAFLNGERKNRVV